MDIIYSNSKVESVCTDYTKALRYFNGDKAMAIALLSRINALAEAETLHDIIVQSNFYFHNLIKKKRDLTGKFSIVVKTKKEPWRIVLEPVDESGEPYENCRIDEISKCVRIVEISEVSNHYE